MGRRRGGKQLSLGTESAELAVYLIHDEALHYHTLVFQLHACEAFIPQAL